MQVLKQNKPFFSYFTKSTYNSIFKNLYSAINRPFKENISPTKGVNYRNRMSSFYENSNFIINFQLSKKFSSTTTTSPEVCPSSLLEDTETIFKRETEDYFVHQISTACLAQFSYYIESNGEAAIIDPMRDSDIYFDLLKKRGAKLKYILETHFHADYVSGHLELAKKTGAKIVYGPNAQAKFDIKTLNDGEVLSLGKIGLKALHTPGHTLESTSYLFLDKEKKPKALFTGDFIFLGEVGRPDLAVKGNMTEKELAGMLYDSIQKVKRELPGETVLFPAHGAGSSCGKNIAKGNSDTLRHQIKSNYALNDNLARDQFINMVTNDLPAPPKYFFFDAMINKTGYNTLDEIKQKIQFMKPQEFYEKFKTDPSIAVIDCREHSVSRQSFLKGSYLISLAMPFAIWVANLFKPDQKFIIIAEKEKQQESIIRLARVGYDNIVGILDSNFEDLANYLIENKNGEDLASVVVMKPEEVKPFLEENKKAKKFEVVDVREKSEWDSVGVVPNSHLISLKNLEENVEKVCSLSPSIGVYCKTGARASIAASILKKHNVKNVIVLGGYEQMKQHDVQFEKLKSN